MSDRERIVVEFIRSLIRLSQNSYQKAKATLLADASSDVQMMEFLTKAFDLAESYRERQDQ